MLARPAEETAERCDFTRYGDVGEAFGAAVREIGAEIGEAERGERAVRDRSTQMPAKEMHEAI